jgi:hypothetical protein
MASAMITFKALLLLKIPNQGRFFSFQNTLGMSKIYA